MFAVILFYYLQIQNGVQDRGTIIDYAIAESQSAGLSIENQQKVIGIIKAESGFNPKALHENDTATGCNSRGLVQIRDCNHKEVSVEQAYNPIFAVNFLIKNIDKCETWWKATCPSIKH